MSFFAMFRDLDRKFSWSFFSFLLAALFGMIAIYDRFITNKHPQLYFDVLTSTAVLDIKEDLPKLEILFDGINIREQNLSLRVVSIKVVNDSSRDILKGDYDPDDPIGFRVQGGKIIRADLVETSNDYLGRNVSSSSPSNDVVHFKDVILEAHQYFVVKLLVLHPASQTPTLIPVGHIAGVKDILVREPYKELGHISIWAGAFGGSWVIQLLRVVAYFIIAILVTLAIVIPFVFLSEKFDKHRRKRFVKEFKTITSVELKKSDEFIFSTYVADGQDSIVELHRLATNRQALAHAMELREWWSRRGEKRPAVDAHIDQRHVLLYPSTFLLSECSEAGLVKIQGKSAVVDPHGRDTLEHFLRFLKNKGLISEKKLQAAPMPTSDERTFTSPEEEQPSPGYIEPEPLPEDLKKKLEKL